MKALKFRRISCYSDKSISRSKCATINNNNKTLLSFTNSKHCLVLRIRRSIREKCSTLGGLGCKLTNNRTKRFNPREQLLSFLAPDASCQTKILNLFIYPRDSIIRRYFFKKKNTLQLDLQNGKLIY